MTDIVGLSGFAGVGKDEAAKALVGKGYHRIAFADILRKMAYHLDPYVDTANDPVNPSISRLQVLVDTEGWDTVKNNYDDVRRLLQRLGTDAGRNVLGENVWVDAALNRVPGSRLVVTDTRFPNEAQAIRDRGGIVVRIERPGVGPRNDHPSETSLVDYNFDDIINNDGTIEDLHDKMIAVVNRNF